MLLINVLAGADILCFSSLLLDISTNLIFVSLKTEFFNYKSGQGFLVSDSLGSSIDIEHLYEGDTIEITWRVESNSLSYSIFDTLEITNGVYIDEFECNGYSSLFESTTSTVTAKARKISISAKNSGITHENNSSTEELVKTYIESIKITKNNI